MRGVMFKKIFSATLLSTMLFSNALAFDYSENDIEHLQVNQNSKINLVKVTPCGNIIQKEN